MKGRAARAGVVLACASLIAAPGCAPAHDVEALYARLQSNDIEDRQDAQETIEKIIREGDYRVFVKGAASPVKAHRAPSILYLARMTQPEARAALRDLLRVERRTDIPFNPIRMKAAAEETDSRILVAHLIASNGGDPEAVDALLAGAAGQPADVLTGTCFAAGALRDPKAIPFLVETTRNPDVEAVRAAVQALGMFRTPEALAGLKGVLGHPSQEVRSETLSALQLQEGPAAFELLKTMAAADPSAEIRAAAIAQLGRFRDPAPVPFLIERLQEKDESDRRAAHETLRLWSGQNFGPQAETWARWWERNRQALAARH